MKTHSLFCNSVSEVVVGNPGSNTEYQLSTSKTRVFSIHILNHIVLLGENFVLLFNGISSVGLSQIKETSVSNNQSGTTINFGKLGVLFNSALLVLMGSEISSVTVTYRLEK